MELFAIWLTESGFARLVGDRLGEELAEARREREDKAYVRAGEIVDVVEGWELYQGRAITAENVRAWLGQVESHVDQRMLFKLLQNMRFFRDVEVREMFSNAHNWIRSQLPVPVKRSKAQRRGDIVVCFLDGAGKSGAHYGGLYARANGIRAENVRQLKGGAISGPAVEPRREFGVVVVDDIVGTGDTLIGGLRELGESRHLGRIGVDVPLAVVVVCSTPKGERRVRAHLQEAMPNADLEVCERLGPTHCAFGENLGVWESEEEADAARTLAADLGLRVDRRRPLGYAGQGLLVTFSRNCPNNSLPILHGSGKGRNPWKPLFARTKA